jgi:hypothetical protein
MKITIRKPTGVDVTHLKVSLPIRYGTEDIPDDFPFRKGNRWEALIDVDAGAIIGWPQGRDGELTMKVVDEGCYTLLDAGGETILALIGEYVPHALIPGEYGDYVQLVIDATGRITNWAPNPANVAKLIEGDQS